MNRYVTAGLAVIAMIAPAQAGDFPVLTAKEPALVCHYLLTAKVLTRDRLVKETSVMTKLPECYTLEKGTEVVAEDTDGGVFIGVTFPTSKTPRQIWWTLQDWFIQLRR